MNVMAINVIIITGSTIWVIMKIYKCRHKLSKCIQRSQSYEMRTIHRTAPSWTILRGNLGEYLLLNQQENLIYHPIKKQIFSTETQLRVDHTEIPPWNVLKDYHKQLQHLKPAISPNTNGEYTINLKGNPEIIYNKDEGEWLQGDTRVIGFPEP